MDITTFKKRNGADHTAINHQYRSDQLFQRILNYFKRIGKSEMDILATDLAAVDEFHVGGLAATTELANRLDLHKGTNVLDVGCGLGGASRYLAGEYGCSVHGIDINTDYIDTAQKLSNLIGQKNTQFSVQSALELSFNSNHFDVVWTQHVQMNIENKQRFYEEIFRVLKPGGVFMYYDLMKGKNQLPVYFPVPWADTSALSFLITPNDLKNLLTVIGFEEINLGEHTVEGVSRTRNVISKMEDPDSVDLGLDYLMGTSTISKLKNVTRSLVEGRLLVRSGLFRKPLE